MASKPYPLRIGFDFDGVVAYNPLRTLRLPLMMMVKALRSPKKRSEIHFPYPKHPFLRFVWEQAHKTSFFPAPGFSHLKELLKEKKIKGYLVTGRYAFLSDELDSWLVRNEIDGLFESVHVNMRDEQPHLFKERMIEALSLDYFVEDNWDIVNYLSSKYQGSHAKQKTEIHWIYNIIDRFRSYEHKHPYLGRFLEETLPE